MAVERTAYRVWDDHAGRRVLRLTSVPCEVRAKSVRFPEYHRAFACHTVVPLDEVRFSRDEAITQYVVGNLKRIDRLRAQIAMLELEIDAARTLTDDEPLAVVKREDDSG